MLLVVFEHSWHAPFPRPRTHSQERGLGGLAVEIMPGMRPRSPLTVLLGAAWDQAPAG